MFWLKVFGQHRGGFAGRKMTEIDFGQAEARFLGGDGDVAARRDRQRTTEAPAGDSSDDRLRQSPEHLVAPAPHLVTQLITYPLWLTFHVQGILFQILPRTKIFAGAGQYNYTRVRVVAEIRQQLEHLVVEFRTHRVPLFRTIESNRSDAVFLRHQ